MEPKHCVFIVLLFFSFLIILGSSIFHGLRDYGITSHNNLNMTGFQNQTYVAEVLEDEDLANHNINNQTYVEEQILDRVSDDITTPNPIGVRVKQLEKTSKYYDANEHKFKFGPVFKLQPNIDNSDASYEERWNDFVRNSLKINMAETFLVAKELNLTSILKEISELELSLINGTSENSDRCHKFFTQNRDFINYQHNSIVYSVLLKLFNQPEIRKMIENEESPSKAVEMFANCIAGPEFFKLCDSLSSKFCESKLSKYCQAQSLDVAFHDCISHVNSETGKNYETHKNAYENQ